MLSMKPKLRIINQEIDMESTMKNNSVFMAINEIAKLNNINIVNKVPEKDIFNIFNKELLCKTCDKECNTSKIKISGQHIVLCCDKTKKEKILSTIPIDNNLLGHIDYDCVCNNIINNLDNYYYGIDMGMADFINHNLSKIIRKTGTIIFIYNGTTRLWCKCESLEFASLVISKYFNQILTPLINYHIKKLKDEGKNYQDLSGDEQKSTIPGKLIALSNKTKKINYMAMILKTCIPLFINFEHPVGSPFHFPIRDGKVVNLKTGEITERNKEHCFTAECRYTYLGPNHNCIHMKRFINSMFSDSDESEYIQKLLGYFLSGDNCDKAYYIFWGDGDNGKTVVMENILLELLGNFQVTLMPCTLTGKNSKGATPEIIHLINARLAIISELGKGEKLNTALIKNLTGGDTAGDTITARPLYGKPIEFKNMAKIVMVTNNQPDIDYDHAIANRTRLIPFSKKFLYEEEYNKCVDKTNKDIRDPDFIKDLTENHMDEVLTYLVNGAIKFFAEKRHSIPPRFKAVCKDYLDDNDNMGKFIEECCVSGNNLKIKSGDLLSHYNEWAILNGVDTLNTKTIKNELTLKGYKYKKIGTIHVLGIELNTGHKLIANI